MKFGQLSRSYTDDLYGRICMSLIRFKIELTLSFKNRIIQILMQKFVSISQFTLSG